MIALQFSWLLVPQAMLPQYFGMLTLQFPIRLFGAERMNTGLLKHYKYILSKRVNRNLVTALYAAAQETMLTAFDILVVGKVLEKQWRNHEAQPDSGRGTPRDKKGYGRPHEKYEKAVQNVR
jgi:hypothetical protein